jgi:hypothetical protein
LYDISIDAVYISVCQPTITMSRVLLHTADHYALNFLLATMRSLHSHLPHLPWLHLPRLLAPQPYLIHQHRPAVPSTAEDRRTRTRPLGSLFYNVSLYNMMQVARDICVVDN